jgi:hypothetical protein
MQFTRQSQQAWIILQHFLSLLMQVKQTPSLVVSQRQSQQDRLHWHIIISFHMQQQLQSLPASVSHKVCNVLQALSSSQQQ